MGEPAAKTIHSKDDTLSLPVAQSGFFMTMLRPEIRNHIYLTVQQDLELATDTDIVTHKPNDNITSWDYRCLMQSCRLLRSEFRPIYLVARTVRCSSDNVLLFIDSQYWKHEYGFRREKTHKCRLGLNIKLHEGGGTEIEDAESSSWSFDENFRVGLQIAPLLRFCLQDGNDTTLSLHGKGSNAMPTKRRTSAQRLIEVVNDSLDNYRSGWRNILGELESIELMSYTLEPYIHITFKSDTDINFGQGWGTRECDKQLALIMRSLGLADCTVDDIRFYQVIKDEEGITFLGASPSDATSDEE